MDKQLLEITSYKYVLYLQKLQDEWSFDDYTTNNT